MEGAAALARRRKLLLGLQADYALVEQYMGVVTARYVLVLRVAGGKCYRLADRGAQGTDTVLAAQLAPDFGL